MTSRTQIHANKVLREARRDVQAWTKAMNQAAAALSMKTARVANELTSSVQYWQKTLKQLEEQLKKLEDPTPADVDDLLDLLPPNRAVMRFHLERMTTVYDEICLASGVEIAELFKQAEAAISRGDQDISMNLLDHVMKRDGRFYPAMLQKGILLLKSNQNRAEAVKLFEKASNQPPSVETERYKGLALELLAHAYEVNNHNGNAIKILKRLRSIREDDPVVDYCIARNAAVTGHSNDMATNLESAARQRPPLLSMALTDQEFAKVRGQILELMESLNEQWGERSVRLIDHSRPIVDIARDYELDQLEPAVKEGIEEFDTMDRSLEQGCYSVYRDLVTNRMSHWAQDFPARVKSRLVREINQRLGKVEEHNLTLQQRARRRRNLFLSIAVPLWIALSVAVMLVLQLATQNLTVSIGGLAVMLGAGVFPIRYGVRMLERPLLNRKLNKDSLHEVKQEVARVESARNDVLKLLKKEGVDLPKAEKKV